MNTIDMMKQKLYIFSYVVLMAASMICLYSEFNSVNQIPKPGYVKSIWLIGIGIFILVQASLLLFNANGKLKIICLMFLSSLFLLFMIGWKSINLQIICVSFLLMNSDLIEFKSFIKVDFITRVICLSTVLLMFFSNVFPSQYDVYVTRGSTIKVLWDLIIQILLEGTSYTLLFLFYFSFIVPVDYITSKKLEIYSGYY